MWLSDSSVIVQQGIDLPNLDAILEHDHALDEEARLALIGALADRVEKLHEQRIAHGDLKPSNILIDPAAPGQPILVDLVDFSVASDGEIASRRYAPEAGGRYERDCFAITAKIGRASGRERVCQDV